jgi:hypothetical protein
MAKELLTSTRIARSFTYPSVQEELLRRTNRIINPEVPYKFLSITGLVDALEPAETKRSPGKKRDAKRALLETKQRSMGKKADDWINVDKKNISPLEIASLPKQKLLVLNREVVHPNKHIISHTLLHKKRLLEKGAPQNKDLLRFIVQTAVELAQKERALHEQLSSSEVLYAFAASVALAQVYMTRGNIKDVLEVSPAQEAHSVKLIAVEKEHGDLWIARQKKIDADLDRKGLKRALRSQILLYAIGVYSLYGFKDVMDQLIGEKMKLHMAQT